MFDTNRLVFTDQFRCQLVEKIISFIRNTFVNASDMLLRFLPVGAARSTPSHPPLPKRQLFLILAVKAGVGIPFTIRAYSILFQTQIDSDMCVHLRQWVLFNFATKRNEKFSTGVLTHGSGQYPAFQLPGVCKTHPAEFWELQATPLNGDIPVREFGRVTLNRMLPALKAWRLILLFEKAIKAIRHMTGSRLQSNAIDFFQPVVLCF
ncbi:hypothetical protein D3C80_1255940 [compost metagenome]